jgi:RNA polymerase sigma factor (sigma-70 family)
MDQPTRPDNPGPKPFLEAGVTPASAAEVQAESHRAHVTELFNKYRASLLRYLGRLVPAEDAAELVQESYFRLLRRGELIKIEAMARAFLFETAINLARDLHRRRITHRADQHVPIDGLELTAEHQRPDDHLAEEQVRVILERAISSLPQETRTVFLLHRYRDLNYPQIAEVMSISARTVARKMADAIEQLSAAFGQLT